MFLGPHRKKTVKISLYNEECNNIFELVGLPGINEEVVEALKGVLR